MHLLRHDGHVQGHIALHGRVRLALCLGDGLPVESGEANRAEEKKRIEEKRKSICDMSEQIEKKKKG
jgi:hypothetical protein